MLQKLSERSSAGDDAEPLRRGTETAGNAWLWQIVVWRFSRMFLMYIAAVFVVPVCMNVLVTEIRK